MRKFKKKRVRNEEILILKKKVVAYNNKISFEKKYDYWGILKKYEIFGRRKRLLIFLEIWNKYMSHEIFENEEMWNSKRFERNDWRNF